MVGKAKSGVGVSTLLYCTIVIQNNAKYCCNRLYIMITLNCNSVLLYCIALCCNVFYV